MGCTEDSCFPVWLEYEFEDTAFVSQDKIFASLRRIKQHPGKQLWTLFTVEALKILTQQRIHSHESQESHHVSADDISPHDFEGRNDFVVKEK